MKIDTTKYRDQILLAGVAVLFVIVIVPFYYVLFGNENAKLRTRRNRLNQEIEKLERDVRRKDEIKNRLDDLTSKSLPPGNNVAQSLYQNWLMDTADEVGLRDKRIDPGSVTSLKNHYKKFTFTLHGRGSLEQIAEFLRRFHKADYLHFARKVMPRPVKESKEMDVSITVEALSLPQARPGSMLPALAPDWQSISDEERAQLKTIADRALFSTYVAPRPEGETAQTAPSPTDEFDHSPYTYVTASVIDKDGRPQVWVDIRTQDKKHQLYVGDMFRLGGVRCFVRKIEFDRAEFEAAGGSYTVKVGSSFAEYE